MNLRLLALCSIEGINWNVVAREALRSGGLARLLAGDVGETSRDGEVTRTRIAAELATLDERVERMQVVVADAQDRVGGAAGHRARPRRVPVEPARDPEPAAVLFCAFLMASLVTREEWAQRYLERGAIEVHEAEDILRWLRSPEQVEQQSSQRDQLELERHMAPPRSSRSRRARARAVARRHAERGSPSSASSVRQTVQLSARAPRRPAYRALIATALMTGMRLSELLGLIWDDIDFIAGSLRVRSCHARGPALLPGESNRRQQLPLATSAGTTARDRPTRAPLGLDSPRRRRLGVRHAQRHAAQPAQRPAQRPDPGCVSSTRPAMRPTSARAWPAVRSRTC
jgi:integrase